MRANFRTPGEILTFLTAALLSLLLLPVPAYSAETTNISGKNRQTRERADSKTIYILGVNWQPAFCEARPKTPECSGQTAERVDARQFSLSGLWKLRQTYCGVAAELKEQDKQKKWLDMPELALDENVQVELARAMPGMASGLERHAWVKHGTCSGELASDYYARSLKMLASLNQTDVQSLFEANIGQSLKQDDIRAAFDTSFGPGAGDKVKMRCRKDGERQIITGLTIGLGDISEGEDDLATLIAAAGKTKFGCAEGVVDAVGLQ